MMRRMDTNYLGTSPHLSRKAPITVIHPGNSFIQCSPIGQPLVKGSVFRPKPMIKPTVVVEDTDTGTITTDDEFERALEDNIWVDTSHDPYNHRSRSAASSHATNGLSNLIMNNDADDEDDTPVRPPPPLSDWEREILSFTPVPQKSPPPPPPRAHPLKTFNFPAAPPAPPPRFSSTGRAATLPRQATGSKNLTDDKKKHVSKIHCMVNFQPSTAVDHVTRTKGYSASLPRNMGRMKNKEFRSSIKFNTNANLDQDKPKFHQSASLPVAYEDEILNDFSNGDLSSSFPPRTNGFSYFTSDEEHEHEPEEEDDFFAPPANMPPLRKYNGVLKSEQYRNIISQTGKSATLPRNFSHRGNIFPAKKKPIQRSASPLVLMPVSEDGQNHSSSLTLFSRPKTDLGWSTPQMKRSTKTTNPYRNNGLLSSLSSYELRSNPPMMNGGFPSSNSFINPGQISPMPMDPEPPTNMFNDSSRSLSPFPVESGRVTPFLAEMERKLMLTPELGRKSPFMPAFTSSPFMDESGRLSPYPTTDTSRGPSPIFDGRESPLPTQQGKIIRVFHAPGKAFTGPIGSPHLSAENRATSPFLSDRAGRMSPFPLDNGYNTLPQQQSQLVHGNRHTSPYIASSMPDMTRFGAYTNGNMSGGIGGDHLQYASGPIPYEEMDYDNLDNFQTLPSQSSSSQRQQKPVITHHITRVTEASNLDDYDNLDSATSRPLHLGPGPMMMMRPGQATTVVKHDKSIDNPHFPNADDPRRQSLIWVKGYSTTMSLGGEICTRCGQGFNVSEEIVKCNGESWHTRCFVDKKDKGLSPEQRVSVTNGQKDGEGVAQPPPSPHPSPTPTPPSSTAENNVNKSGSDPVKAPNTNGFHGSEFSCEKCEQILDKTKTIVNYNGQAWHPHCFVCAQCFQPFPDGIFYEFEGRKYCEHDFHVLFAPCCGRCREFIVGRVIKAMNANWHPDCFQCELCSCSLADAGFIKNAGRALCRECNAREKALGMGKYVCHKCHSIIDDGHIKYRGEAYHPYHFNCTTCGVELNPDAREKGGELYCLRCHDKMGIPICGACRRPIEERVVHALGKAWHVEHFVCAKCEKPFLGHRHYEKKGLAYCETHYHQLFGNICFVCNNVISGDVFSALNKSWCVHHFACSVCDKKMSQNTSSGLCGFSGGETIERKASRYCGLYPSGSSQGEMVARTKFFEYDLKPVCKGCYDHFPGELKKRLKKAYDASPKK